MKRLFSFPRFAVLSLIAVLLLMGLLCDWSKLAAGPPVGFPGTVVWADQGSPQRDHGAQVFTQRCSTCHGDKGQGLTLEWRQTWDIAHQNCSQSKCHGRDHPPDGFELPNNYAPAIIGPGTLTRFQTAADLFNFISVRMPYSAPGILPTADYWALTAFLVDAHGISVNHLTLDAYTARSIYLRPEAGPGGSLPQTVANGSTGDLPGSVSPSFWISGLVVAGVVVGAAGLVIWFTRRRWARRRIQPSPSSQF